MTVENVTPLIRYPYTGPGAYSFSFLLYDEDDLTITHTDVYGNRTALTITTDYTVTINSGSPGGSVTMIYSETTGAIEIARVLDYTQTTAWENEGALDMQLLEQDFDRTVMLVQQLKSEFYRAPAQATLRGDWVTATTYVQGDVVWDSTGEIFYACYTDHTSGVLATDVAAGYWFESLDLTSIYADAINAAVALAVVDKADLVSPALTGTPTATTATAGTETTQLATTEYVIDTAQRRLTAVSGLNNEGEVIGFDMTSMTGNALTFSKGSCLDSILKVPIVFTSNKTVTLASTNNAEFFIFAVRLIDTVTFEARAYTTYAGPASDAQIDSWRFIGYAKNNGSGVTFPHVMVDGVIDFTTLSSTAAPLITATMTTSYVEYTLSTVVDMTVLRELWICSTTSGCNLTASYAGAADVSPASAAFTPIVLLPRSSIYLKYSNNNGPAVVKRVKLRR